MKSALEVTTLILRIKLIVIKTKLNVIVHNVIDSCFFWEGLILL